MKYSHNSTQAKKSNSLIKHGENTSAEIFQRRGTYSQQAHKNDVSDYQETVNQNDNSISPQISKDDLYHKVQKQQMMIMWSKGVLIHC